ncbi:alpha/beta hydrolase [Aquitalea sp.]|uniref:alpha/beta hydrolase n=1 Tax=Aquitalea sp. TaxID=1872623 RepID=UPI0025872250|nr:alpha/beta hydrolase [Aquitalea sp.]
MMLLLLSRQHQQGTRAVMLDDDDVVLITVPGWGNSGDRHWQTLWELTYPLARRVQQLDWLYPERTAWVAALDALVRDTPGRIVLAAHSLGCHTTVAWLRTVDFATQRRIKGVLLVAPPALPITEARARVSGELPEDAAMPAFSGFELPDCGVLPVPAVLVASRDDLFCDFAVAESMASGWGVRLLDAGKAGHMGSHAGLGSWALGQQLLQRFILA